MNDASNPGAILALLSVVGTIVTIAGGLIAWFKLRPEIQHLRAQTSREVVQQALEQDAAETTKLTWIIDKQVSALITPLEDRVARQEVKINDQEARIDELEGQVRSIRRQYRLAVDTLRAYAQYALKLVGMLPDSVTPPVPPVIPNDIADDL